MKIEKIENWFIDRLETESIEIEESDSKSLTVITQEELSLDLIKKVMESESELGVKITDIRNHAFGLCIDLEHE